MGLELVLRLRIEDSEVIELDYGMVNGVVKVEIGLQLQVICLGYGMWAVPLMLRRLGCLRAAPRSKGCTT